MHKKVHGYLVIFHFSQEIVLKPKLNIKINPSQNKRNKAMSKNFEFLNFFQCLRFVKILFVLLGIDFYIQITVPNWLPLKPKLVFVCLNTVIQTLGRLLDFRIAKSQVTLLSLTLVISGRIFDKTTEENFKIRRKRRIEQFS